MLKTLFFIHISDIVVLFPNEIQLTNCVPLGHRSVALYAVASFNSVQWYILLLDGQRTIAYPLGTQVHREAKKC